MNSKTTPQGIDKAVANSHYFCIIGFGAKIMKMLKDIATVKAGHSFRGAINEDLSGNGYVIQVRNQRECGEIAWDELVRAQIPGLKEPEWLREGDIIFSARGPRNIATAIKNVDRPTVCSPHFFVISLSQPHALPEFIAWQLNHKNAQNYLRRAAEGSAQVSIRRTVLESVSIALPPLKKQKQIMQFVAAAKEEQQLLNQLIENRERQLVAIANDILK